MKLLTDTVLGKVYNNETDELIFETGTYSFSKLMSIMLSPSQYNIWLSGFDRVFNVSNKRYEAAKKYLNK